MGLKPKGLSGRSTGLQSATEELLGLENVNSQVIFFIYKMRESKMN